MDLRNGDRLAGKELQSSKTYNWEGNKVMVSLLRKKGCEKIVEADIWKCVFEASNNMGRNFMLLGGGECFRLCGLQKCSFITVEMLR